jgi:hypothetical protein
MQAPFRVVVDYGPDRIGTHDLARFVFGFSVEFVTASDAADVVSRVAASGSDLGLIPAGTTDSDPWWRRLSDTKGPRIMSVLPFIDQKGRTASAPAFVISPLLAEPTPPDLRVFAATSTDAGETELRKEGHVVVLAATPGRTGHRELMVALPSGDDEASLHLRGVEDIAPIGGIARGIADAETGSALRSPFRSGPGS